jgi:YVTN family beta-propeller protein
VRIECAVSILGALSAIASTSACSTSFLDERNPARSTAAFKNEFNLNPIHETITVDGLGFLRSEVRNILAVKNAAFDLAFVSFAPAHFDNCTFGDSTLFLRDNYTNAVDHALEFPAPFLCPSPRILDCDTPASGDASLTYFAHVLHAVQDFYAHSNWVEIMRQGGVALEPVGLIDSNTEEFPFISGGTTLGGAIIVDGQDNQGWVFRPPAHNQTYPAAVIPHVCKGNDCRPAVVSGRTSGVGATTPDDCPPQDRLFHDADLAKDEPDGVRLFDDAMTMATLQTRHEWCRFVEMVRHRHAQPGDTSLYAHWVQDVVAARCGAAVDLEADAMTIPPTNVPLEPGSSPAYTFSLRNNGTAEAFGSSWTASFMGSVDSLGAATVVSPAGATACDVSGLTVTCRLPQPLAEGQMATVVVTVVPGLPGTIDLRTEVSSHNPDPLPDNDYANFQLTVECPARTTFNQNTRLCEAQHRFVAYVANLDGRSISVVDLTSNAVVGQITDADGLPSSPYALALSPGADFLWVSHAAGGFVSYSLIDLRNNRVAGQFGSGAAFGIAASANGAVATNHATNSLVALTANAGIISQQQSGCPSTSGGAWGIALAPDGSTLVTCADSGFVVGSSLSGGRIQLPNVAPTEIALAPTLGRVYVAGGQAAWIDLSTSSVGGMVPVSDVSGLAVSPDGARAFLSERLAGSVAILDTARNEVAARLAVGRIPWGIGISSDGSRVVVANRLNNSVSIIDPTMPAVIATVSVGAQPVEVVIADRM